MCNFVSLFSVLNAIPERVQAKLAAQAANMNSLSDGDINASQNAAMEKQRQEYGQRGIALVS